MDMDVRSKRRTLCDRLHDKQAAAREGRAGSALVVAALASFFAGCAGMLLDRLNAALAEDGVDSARSP
jgi:hypothetical protein